MKSISLSFTTLLSLVFIAKTVSSIVFNATVSLDGSEKFNNVNDAVLSAPNWSSTRFYIHIKSGIYRENVIVLAEKQYISLIGDDAKNTIIVSDHSYKTGFKTFDSATITVHTVGFVAQSLTFENSAGPNNGQAVALLDDGSRSAYYKCIFLGFQDTLYANGPLQFFKECDIYGTIDFIFGRGSAVFQNCNIYARLSNTDNVVTAQSKSYKDQHSGFVFQRCFITVSPEIESQKASVKIYLGRPWQSFSSVVFIQCFMDGVVDPSGWLEWPGNPVNLLYYAEFMNWGPGASTSKRVNWPGYHVIKDNITASQFTVENFISGNTWLQETNVPYIAGLNPVVDAHGERNEGQWVDAQGEKKDGRGRRQVDAPKLCELFCIYVVFMLLHCYIWL